MRAIGPEARLMRSCTRVLLLSSALGLLDACGGGGSTNPGSLGPTHFSVSGPVNIPSGTPFFFSVTALDASNNRTTNYSGTVHFTSTDPTAQLPPDSPLGSGSKAFSAT